jgi:hypothetical protein
VRRIDCPAGPLVVLGSGSSSGLPIRNPVDPSERFDALARVLAHAKTNGASPQPDEIETLANKARR